METVRIVYVEFDVHNDNILFLYNHVEGFGNDGSLLNRMIRFLPNRFFIERNFVCATNKVDAEWERIKLDRQKYLIDVEIETRTHLK